MRTSERYAIGRDTFPSRLHLTQFAIAATATTIAVSEWLSDGIDPGVTLKWVGFILGSAIFGFVLGGLPYLFIKSEFDDKRRTWHCLVAAPLGPIVAELLCMSHYDHHRSHGPDGGFGIWSILLSGPLAVVLLFSVRACAQFLYQHIRWGAAHCCCVSLQGLITTRQVHVDDRGNVKSMLHLAALSASIENVVCESSDWFGKSTSCRFEVSPDDFAKISAGQVYAPLRYWRSSAHIRLRIARKNFVADASYDVTQHKQGDGWISVYFDKQHRNVVVERSF